MKIQFDKGMAKVVPSESETNLNPKVLFAQENGKVLLTVVSEKVGILRNVLRLFHVTPKNEKTEFYAEISPDVEFFSLNGLLHLGYRQSNFSPTRNPDTARVTMTKEQVRKLLEAIES